MNGKTRHKTNEMFPQDVGNELTLLGKLDTVKANELLAENGLPRHRKSWNMFAKIHKIG
jgi:hypothetical protein